MSPAPREDISAWKRLPWMVHASPGGAADVAPSATSGAKPGASTYESREGAAAPACSFDFFPKKKYQPMPIRPAIRIQRTIVFRSMSPQPACPACAGRPAFGAGGGSYPPG